MRKTLFRDLQVDGKSSSGRERKRQSPVDFDSEQHEVTVRI